jgi:hypothetical protein
VAEDAAAQVGAEVVLDPAGDAVAVGVALLGEGEERLQVVLDDRIEGSGGRTPRAVEGRTGRGLRPEVSVSAAATDAARR